MTVGPRPEEQTDDGTCVYRNIVPVECIDAQTEATAHGFRWRCDWLADQHMPMPLWLMRQTGGCSLVDLDTDCAGCPVKKPHKKPNP